MTFGSNDKHSVRHCGLDNDRRALSILDAHRLVLRIFENLNLVAVRELELQRPVGAALHIGDRRFQKSNCESGCFRPSQWIVSYPNHLIGIAGTFIKELVPNRDATITPMELHIVRTYCDLTDLLANQERQVLFCIFG
jgi:hypothetical protein